MSLKTILLLPYHPFRKPLPNKLKSILLRIFFIIVSVFLVSVSCKNENQPVSILAMTNQEYNGIRCTDNGCSGSYTGDEFINGDDVARQFSNTMSNAVGKQAKRTLS